MVATEKISIKNMQENEEGIEVRHYKKKKNQQNRNKDSKKGEEEPSNYKSSGKQQSGILPKQWKCVALNANIRKYRSQTSCLTENRSTN